VSVGAALLFPGQGAQVVGMGRAAYERSRAARAVFAQAEDTLRYPLSRLSFEGPPGELQQTRWQQPAILTCSLALLAAHEEGAGPFQRGCVTGHSLGLYSALVAAGSLSLDVAVGLVALRAELM
jgi:[acyl-carrier-protein] S-malonyltransferase